MNGVVAAAVVVFVCVWGGICHDFLVGVVTDAFFFVEGRYASSVVGLVP